MTDYCDVDPRLGTLSQLNDLVGEAHALSLGVLVDLVPNHTSSRHRWFVNARRDRQHPDRRRYVWRAAGSAVPSRQLDLRLRRPGLDPSTSRLRSGTSTSSPPSSPTSIGGNGEVDAYFADVVRFWLDQGVDGFRIDSPTVWSRTRR